MVFIEIEVTESKQGLLFLGLLLSILFENEENLVLDQYIDKAKSCNYNVISLLNFVTKMSTFKLLLALFFNSVKYLYSSQNTELNLSMTVYHCLHITVLV